MTFESFLFWLLASITGLAAVMVVVTQNIVRCAVWLLFSLGGAAGIFFLLGADFVGATQLIVYVGGTLVLVVFGVMLTAQGPFISMKTGAAEWGLSAVVGVLSLGVLIATLTARGSEDFRVLGTNKQVRGQPPPPAESASAMLVGEALLGVKEASPEGNLSGLPEKDVPRQPVSYLLPFEIVSVHLLVVLIGAAYLARAKRRRGGAA